MEHNGKFVISLDFELMWGVFDKRSSLSYGANILGAREVIPKLIQLFEQYEIGATWAIVGCLFFDNKIELLKKIPKPDFEYKNPKLSAHKYLNQIGLNEESDPYHYGLSLINLINQSKFQEIGTHTFTHFYCLEDGINVEMFKSDIHAAKQTATSMGIELNSIIFPRNQYNQETIEALKELQIKAYRGNHSSWLYAPRNGENESSFRRILRLIDSFINLSGSLCHSINSQEGIVNIPASSFLRPYNRKLRFLDSLKINRIKKSMEHAAKNNLLYHLWWHPHNFGVNQEENLSMLKSILEYYSVLQTRYGFKSYTMKELSNEYILPCQPK